MSNNPCEIRNYELSRTRDERHVKRHAGKCKANNKQRTKALACMMSVVVDAVVGSSPPIKSKQKFSFCLLVFIYSCSYKMQIRLLCNLRILKEY